MNKLHTPEGTLIIGVLLALFMRLLTKATESKLDWKKEVQVLIVPALLVFVTGLTSGMSYFGAFVAAATALGIPLGLSSQAKPGPAEITGEVDVDLGEGSK